VCKVTRLGRARFLDYLAVLDRVVRDAAMAVEAARGPSPLPGLAPA
jgi:hypothetical protein